MVKIIANKELEVIKLENKVKFNIKKNKYTNFYNKIKNILGVKNNQFTIPARNFVGLNDLVKRISLSYKQANTLFQTLFMQIKDLKDNELSVSFLELNDIYFLEITENVFYFLLLKTDKIKKIENNSLEINEPIKKKDGMFFSPELEKQKSFPSQISFKSCYYSLAMITIHCLKKVTKKEINLSEHVESLVGTPLYWALERCLMKDDENRTFLYI